MKELISFDGDLLHLEASVEMCPITGRVSRKTIFFICLDLILCSCHHWAAWLCMMWMPPGESHLKQLCGESLKWTVMLGMHSSKRVKDKWIYKSEMEVLFYIFEGEFVTLIVNFFRKLVSQYSFPIPLETLWILTTQYMLEIQSPHQFATLQKTFLPGS